MDYRKLIAFGKNSFVISLPKTWIRHNKLVKGDLIYVQENDTNLVLQPHGEEAAQENKEITISIDGKDIKHLKREIYGAYIRNNKTIRLIGNDIKNKAEEIHNIIQSLVALEVMEQTSNTIVAKDFLDLNSVSTKSLIRKMDIITRSMWDDCQNMFIENTYKSINYRDNDVNRLTFLMFRIIRFGLENTSYMFKKFNLTPLDLMSLWWLSYDLESLADEVKRIARYMDRIELKPKQQKEFQLIIEEVRKSYLTIMKAYYDDNVELAYSVINRRSELIKRSEDFYLENNGVKWIGFLVERTKASIGHITHIGRILYQSKEKI